MQNNQLLTNSSWLQYATSLFKKPQIENEVAFKPTEQHWYEILHQVWERNEDDSLPVFIHPCKIRSIGLIHPSLIHFGLFGGCHAVVSRKYTTLCITFFPHSLLRKGRGFVTRSLLSQGSSKGCGPYVVTILNSTLIFKWSMTSLMTRACSQEWTPN